MSRFKSATKNLGFVWNPTDTIQKKEYDEEEGREVWRNKYIVGVEDVFVEEKSFNDDGRVSQADVLIDVTPSEMGEIILESSSYEKAKEKLNKQGYRYKDDLFTEDIVEKLDNQLKLLDYECKTGEILSLNHQSLYDYDSENQVFKFSLDLDSESSNPLMSALKIGDDSIEFTLMETLGDATDWVYSVAWSSDGDYLATGSRDENVYVYNTSDWSLVETLEDSTSTVRSVDWSGDGNYLASGSQDNNVYIYDTSDWSLIEILEDATNWVLSVAWSSDGNYLASGDSDGYVYIYDTSDWSLLETLEDATDTVYSVAWSGDGDYLASGSIDDNVYIYDISDWSLVETLEDSTETVFSVAWSSNGNYLATGSFDYNVYIYDTSDWSLLETLDDATDAVESVAWSSDGNYLASGSWDDNVYIYDTIDGSLVETLEDSTAIVYSVAWSNGYLATGSQDDNVYVYEEEIEEYKGDTIFETKYGLNDRITIYVDKEVIELYPRELTVTGVVNEKTVIDGVFDSTPEVNELLVEGKDILFFENRGVKPIKAEIVDVNLDSQYRLEFEAHSKERSLEKFVTNRQTYENVPGNEIVEDVLENVPEDYVKIGDVEDAPTTTVRADRDSVWHLLKSTADSLGYDVYVEPDEETGYEEDLVYFVDRRGSEEPVKEFEIGENLMHASNETDSEVLANDLYGLGYGDGENQLEVRLLDDAPKTFLEEPVESTDTGVEVEVTDAEVLGSDGDELYLRIGSERVKAEIVSEENNIIKLTERGLEWIDGYDQVGAINHFLNIPVWLEENITQGISFDRDNPWSQSSVGEHGISQDTVQNKKVVDKAAMEKVTWINMQTRLSPVKRIEVHPSNPFQMGEVGLGDNIEIKDSTNSDVNGVFRVVGTERNYGSEQDMNTIFKCVNVQNTLIEEIKDTQDDTEAETKHMQGSTNVNTQSEKDNCDEDNPLLFDVFIPEDVVELNKMRLTMSRQSFRGYVTDDGHIHEIDGSSEAQTDPGTEQYTLNEEVQVDLEGSHSFQPVDIISVSPDIEMESMVLHASVYYEASEEGAGYAQMAIYNVSEDEYYPEDDSGDRLPTNQGHMTTRPDDDNLWEVYTSAHYTIEINKDVTGDELELQIRGADLKEGEVTVLVDYSIAVRGNHYHDIDDTTKAAGNPDYGIHEPDSEPDIDVSIKVDENEITTIEDVSVGENFKDEIDLLPYLEEPVTGEFHRVELVPTDNARLNATIFNKYFINSTVE